MYGEREMEKWNTNFLDLGSTYSYRFSTLCCFESRTEEHRTRERFVNCWGKKNISSSFFFYSVPRLLVDEIN